jgi:hypothetical protein
MVIDDLPLGQRGQCLKLTTHLYLILMLRVYGFIPPIPHNPKYGTEWQEILYFVPPLSDTLES